MNKHLNKFDVHGCNSFSFIGNKVLQSKGVIFKLKCYCWLIKQDLFNISTHIVCAATTRGLTATCYIYLLLILSTLDRGSIVIFFTRCYTQPYL